DPEDIEDIESLEEEHYFFPVIYAQFMQLEKDGPSNIKLIAKSIQLKGARLPYPAFSNTSMQPIFTNFSDPRLSSERMRLVSFPFVLDSRDYIIQFALPQGDVDATLGYLRMIIFITIPLLPLLFFWGGRVLITRALAPVKAVVSSARRITTDNLSLRIPVIHSADEIGELVNTFNDMISRLNSSIAKIKRFSSDVAHEFKTPMTVMLGEIDVLLRKKRPLPEYIDTLTSFREEVVILQKIIDNLLFLDSSESDIGTLTFFDVPLHQVVLGVIEAIEHKAIEKNISIGFGRMDSCVLHGEVTLLKRAFFNLVENACKYTPQKGKIEISLHNADDFLHFSVTDSGVGIAQEHLPNIFDRFFRVDKSRRRSKAGSGLGLCLTKRIIQLHNGDINVVSSPGKGSTFTVSLPLSLIPKVKRVPKVS
ncbi:MAG: HAMP domain-containing protein, partial [bacterium]|nr:HAMP domain-containing protein [bacterium]